MPDSAVPIVRRPVRRVPSSASKESPELRRLSVGEVVSNSNSRGSSAEKEGGTAPAVVGPKVLLRRSVKVKTGCFPAKKKEETALERIMRDDDLPPPFPVSPRDFPVPPSPINPPDNNSSLKTSPAKSRRRVAKTCRDLELEHAVLQWIMTIVHEKPSTDYDTFIQDGSILSKVMTSIVFNSVPLDTTDDNWGANPVLDRIKTVIRELKRYGVVDVFEPEDLMELRNIPKVTKCLAQLSKLAASDKESLINTTITSS